MAEKKIVKVGVMSFAHMHAFSYAQCLKAAASADFVGIADDVLERAKKVAADLGVKAFNSYEEMLESDVDAVVVTSENINHRKHVEMAAAAGKHVMCEKPLATSVEDGNAMIKACRENGVQLMTAFPCRYHPAFKKLKEVVDAGDLGKIIAIKGTNQGQCPGSWFIDKSLAGGGAIIDHTVHVTDLIRALTGAEPVRVYAEISNKMFEKDFDDSGIISIDFDNGMFVTIDSSWSRPKSYPTWGNVNMDVTGTEGIASMEMFAQDIDVYSDKTMRHTWDYWGDNIDMGLVEAFAESIAKGTKVPITGEDGLNAVKVPLAAYKAVETGEPVDL